VNRWSITLIFLAIKLRVFCIGTYTDFHVSWRLKKNWNYKRDRVTTNVWKCGQAASRNSWSIKAIFAPWSLSIPAELRIFGVYPRKGSIIYQERDVRVYLFPARPCASTLVCVARVCVTCKLHMCKLHTLNGMDELDIQLSDTWISSRYEIARKSKVMYMHVRFDYGNMRQMQK